jgi:hypothetical protein
MEATILQRFDDDAVYKALGGLLFLRCVCSLSNIHAPLIDDKFSLLSLQWLGLSVQQLLHLIIMDC